jgi:hypothetical protein
MIVLILVAVACLILPNQSIGKFHAVIPLIFSVFVVEKPFVEIGKCERTETSCRPIAKRCLFRIGDYAILDTPMLNAILLLGKYFDIAENQADDSTNNN